MSQWLSTAFLTNLALKAVRVFEIALIFEILVWIIGKRVDAYLKPVLAADVGRDPSWRLRRRNKLRGVARALIRTALYTFALFFILPVLGVQMVPVYVVFCTLVVPAALIALPLLRDLCAGYVILAEDQFAPGDPVKIGDATGIVETMTLRQTTLRDSQNPEMVHVISNRDIPRVVARRERPEPPRPTATPPKPEG